MLGFPRICRHRVMRGQQKTNTPEYQVQDYSCIRVSYSSIMPIILYVITSVIFIVCADLSLHALPVHWMQMSSPCHSQSIWNRPLLSPRLWQGQQQQHQKQGQGLARTSPDWRPSTADCEERFYTQIVRKQARLYRVCLVFIAIVRKLVALLLVYRRSNAKNM